jgi:hypothetical protein
MQWETQSQGGLKRGEKCSLSSYVVQDTTPGTLQTILAYFHYTANQHHYPPANPRGLSNLPNTRQLVCSRCQILNSLYLNQTPTSTPIDEKGN